MPSFADLVEKTGKGTDISARPGRRKTISERFGLSVDMTVFHPMRGQGRVVEINESAISVVWANPMLAVRGPEQISEGEIPYMKMQSVQETKTVKEKPMKKIVESKKAAPKATKKLVEQKFSYRGAGGFGMKPDFNLTAKELFEDFDLPNPVDSMLTSIEKAPSGESKPLSALDGEGGAPGVNWTPSFSDDPSDAPNRPKIESDAVEPKVVNMGGSAPSRSDSGNSTEESSDDDSGESDMDKGNPFAKKQQDESFELTMADMDSLDGIIYESDDEDSEDDSDKEDSKKESDEDDDSDKDDEKKEKVDECDMGEKTPMENQGLDEHNMAAGEIAVTQDLLKSIIDSAVRDQVDEAGVGHIVAALATCCQGDRTLTIDDADEIMNKVHELAGGEAAPAQEEPAADEPAGDDMGDDEFEDVAKGDGETAGPEGGDEHEGRTKLMAGKGMTESKTAKGKRKPIKEAWMSAIPGTHVGTKPEIEETGDEDFDEIRQIMSRAGLNWHKYQG